MGRLIDADELKLDTEWDDYYDGFTAYSERQIANAEGFKAIRLDAIKQAREEIKAYYEEATDAKQKTAFNACLNVIDVLIAESEEADET